MCVHRKETNVRIGSISDIPTDRLVRGIAVRGQGLNFRFF